MNRLMPKILFCLFFISLISHAQWTSLNGPPSNTNIKDMTIDATGNYIYAIDSLRIMKSTDGGETFDSIANITNARAITCQFNNPDIVYVSGPTYFKKSTDGGNSWSNITAAQYPNAIASFKTSGNYQRIITGNTVEQTGASIYYSTDGGANWTGVGLTIDVTVFDIATYPVNRDDVWNYLVVAATSYNSSAPIGSLWYTTDSNATTWNQGTRPSISSVATTAVAIQDTGSGGYKIFVGTANGRVYKSTGVNQTYYQTSALPDVGTDTIRSIVIDDSGTLFVQSEKYLYRSSNGGANWTKLDDGIVDQEFYSLLLSPADQDQLFAGSGSFLYQTTNAGDDWSLNFSSPSTVFPVISTVASGGVTGSAINGTPLTSSSSGSSWSYTRIGSFSETFVAKSYYRNYLNSSYPYHFLAGSTGGIERMYRSTDGGESFDSVGKYTNYASYYNGIAVDPNNTSHIYAFGSIKIVTSYRNFIYSLDNGSTWEKSTLVIGGGTRPISSIAFTGGPSYEFFAGISIASGSGDSGLFHVESRSTPTKISSITRSVNSVIVNPNFNSVAYAGSNLKTGTGGLWRSTNADADAGSISFSNVFTASAVKKVMFDPRYCYASDSAKYLFWVSSADSVYRSTNGGTSWTNITSGLPVGTVINDLQNDPTDTLAIYLATSNGVYKGQFAGVATNLSPDSNSTDAYYCLTTLSWNAASGATSYHVEVSASATFATIFDSGSSSTNSYTVGTTMTPGTLYYWRVKASNIFGSSRYWANEKFTTTVPIPTLVSPANGATNIEACTSDVTLSWSAPCGTGYYELQIAENAGFTENLLDTTVNATSIVLNLVNGKTYYWKVSVDTVDTWSSTRYFSTTPWPVATPYLPVNNETNVSYCDSLQFVVGSLENAYSYYLVIATDSLFNDVVLNKVEYDTVITFTGAEISTYLDPDITYYWHYAGGYYCDDIYSTFSATRSFTTAYNWDAPKYEVITISPANGDTVHDADVIFTWYAVYRAFKYRIQVSTVANFSTLLVDAMVYFNDTTYTTNDVSCNTTYYWRVRPENCENIRDWSSTWSFYFHCDAKVVIPPFAKNEQLPDNFTLYQNYPNPFNPTTTIYYALPEDANIKLVVYNTLGKEVITLRDGYETAGFKSVTFDATTLPSGIYYYRLITGRFSTTKAMMLVK